MTGDVYNKDYTGYQLQRSPMRKLVRRVYLRHTLKYVKGKTIDFGCGIGELLTLLPAGSLGLEVNETTVNYCRGIGLEVQLYHPECDNYAFIGLEAGEFNTFVMSHVLEHLEKPAEIMRTILHSCGRMGIERFILIVPGLKGFMHDCTHKKFIDSRYLEEHELYDVCGYRILKHEYFPVNVPWAGNFFTHNESLFIYDRTL